MKKISVSLFAFAIAFNFVSCNKSIESRLPATWSVTNQDVKTIQIIGVDSFPTNSSGPGGTYTFKSDGTGTPTIIMTM